MTDLIVDNPDGAGLAVRIRIDAARRRNALTLETVRHLHQLLSEDPHTTMLLGSSTADIFCAGADLDVDDASRAILSDLLYACYEHIVSRPGVVIAVVEGAAVGGGAQLTAVADVRVISAAARWRWVGPGHGLAVGAWILPELFGRTRGLDLALTARWLEAPEAVLAGFAARIDDNPWEHAFEIATRLARADQAAVERVKRIATQPHILVQLAQERAQNKASWTGSAPTASAAAADSRQ